MPNPPDHLALVQQLATEIEQDVKRVVEKRGLLRNELDAAAATGQYSQEDLVRAARGGLTRRLVLAHLAGVADKVRAALKAAELDADVTERRDGTVTIGAVSLQRSRAYDYQPGRRGQWEDEVEPDDDDPGYRLAQRADRTALRNCVNDLLSRLGREGLSVTSDGLDLEQELLDGGVVTIARSDGA